MSDLDADARADGAEAKAAVLIESLAWPKRFAGATGLEEHIGGGFGMALTVRAEAEALIFTSDHYFWHVKGLRLRVPRWLAPGETVVTHRHLAPGRFAFDLQVTHPLFGELLSQHALFRDG
ncbi:MAG TPA: DUF4166 domain-containing protein [Sphingopyxis sp.]|nr:DUF4166 domain-containing protein [Sphingopyxis sp.]